MKKNISINLFGTLYAIDEDAYALLERYLNSMKSYFARQEGGEEIADDIEHRVAELLWQRKQQGMEAVNIDTVRTLIAKIGNPEEIGNSEKAADETAAPDAAADAASGGDFRYTQAEQPAASVFDRMKAHAQGRHLYRDPQNKLLGGVLAGWANYVGTGDPLWWRLGFLGLTLFMWYFDIVGLLLPILYTAFWILVPEPRTPEDRLRMEGRDVNPQNLNEQILRDSANASSQQYNIQPSGGSTVLKVLFGVFLAVLLLPFGVLLLFLLFFIILVVSVFGGFVSNLLPFGVFDNEYARIPEFIQANSTNIWLCIFFGILAIGIPIYVIVRQLFVKGGNQSRGTKVAVAIVWLISLIMLVLTLINNGTRFTHFMHTDAETAIQYNQYDDDEDYWEADSCSVADTLCVADAPAEAADSVAGADESR